jgi:hypothetical protein
MANAPDSQGWAGAQSRRSDRTFSRWQSQYSRQCDTATKCEGIPPFLKWSDPARMNQKCPEYKQVSDCNHADSDCINPKLISLEILIALLERT